MVRLTMVVNQGFESGIASEDKFGWSVQSGGAAAGTSYATSTTDATVSNNWFYLPYGKAPAGARTFISFVSRGSVSTDEAQLWVNEYYSTFPATTEWTRFTGEITDAVQSWGGLVDAYVDHFYLDTSRTSSTWDVDDVQIYTCVQAPSRASVGIGPARGPSTCWPPRPGLTYGCIRAVTTARSAVGPTWVLVGPR